MSRRFWAVLPAGWEVRGSDYLMVADAHGPLASVSARPGSDCCAECLESAPTMRGVELESTGGAL